MDEEALLYEDDYPQDEEAGQAEPDSLVEPQEELTPAPEQAAEEGPAAEDRTADAAGPSGRGVAGAGVAGVGKGRKARDGSGQSIRYFIIRSSTLQNIFISVRVGAWATTRLNDIKLDDAFRGASEVRLLYSVTGSNAFQGYAVMRTPIGKFSQPVVWENGKQFGNPFGVEWRVLFELPRSECDNIRNPFNENKPVLIARDGTEVPQEQGDLIVKLMQGRAAAAGAKPPRQQLALMEAGGRAGPGPGMGMPGRGQGMPGLPPGRHGLGPRAAGMGVGMRPPGIGMPRGGPGMGDPAAAMMAMGGMGPHMRGGMGGINMDQVAAAMTMHGLNPAALSGALQQAGMGLPPGMGGMQQPAALQAVAGGMVAQLANLPAEQQPMAMAAITASNPILAEAMAAIISGGGGGVRPGPAGGGSGPRGGDGLGHGGMGPAAMGGGPGGMGGFDQGARPGQGVGNGDVGSIGPGGMGGMMHQQQRLLLQQQQQQAQHQQAQQQLMDINRDEVFLEGSDGRLRSGRSRSRSRSPVQVHRGGGAGDGTLDFKSMTYEQYLQQYGRVQQEVQRRLGSGNGQGQQQQRERSSERSPRHVREPTPASQAAMGQGRMYGGGGGGNANGMAGGGGGGGAGMAAKPGGQPYTEEEYIRVTQMWYSSRGQAPPTENYIRQHYRQMLSQLQR